jgi:hypothetical protein
VAANRAHTSPYLVRHLASHLRNDERRQVIAKQLRQIPWLLARVDQEGAKSLMEDYADAGCLKELIQLRQLWEKIVLDSHAYVRLEGPVPSTGIAIKLLNTAREKARQTLIERLQSLDASESIEPSQLVDRLGHMKSEKSPSALRAEEAPRSYEGTSKNRSLLHWRLE